jgi:hypothetical protein
VQYTHCWDIENILVMFCATLLNILLAEFTLSHYEYTLNMRSPDYMTRRVRLHYYCIGYIITFGLNMVKVILRTGNDYDGLVRGVQL